MIDPPPTAEDETSEQPRRSLDDIAEEMGPFEPPADLSVEPEFQPQPPRPVPPALRNGPYAKGQRRTAVAMLGSGLICLAFARNGFVQELAYYFLPLKYIDWLGYGLIAFVLIWLVARFIRPGRYAYVRDGVVVIARVLDQGYLTEGTKECPSFRFLTGVDFVDPDTGSIERSWIPSETVGAADSAKRYRLPYAAGDYVTLVYLPGRRDETARIYATLGLNPELDYIHKDGRPKQDGLSLPAACAIIAGVIAVLAVLMGAIYAMDFCLPIAGDWEIAKRVLPIMGVTGILGYIIAVWCTRRSMRRTSDSIAPRAYSRGVIWFVGFAGGVIIGGIGTIVANAALDRSEPEYRDVEIIEFWQTTHSWVFRDYSLEYAELDADRVDKYPARVPHMEQFADTRTGVIEVRNGFLGMPFVRQIHPVVITRIDDPGPDEGVIIIETSTEDADPGTPGEPEPVLMQVGLRIELDDGRHLPVSPRLAELTWSNVAAEGLFEGLFNPPTPATQPDLSTSPAASTQPF